MILSIEVVFTIPARPLFRRDAVIIPSSAIERNRLSSGLIVVNCEVVFQVVY